MATTDEKRAAAWAKAKAARDAAIEAARLPNGTIDVKAVDAAKAEWAKFKKAARRG